MILLMPSCGAEPFHMKDVLSGISSMYSQTHQLLAHLSWSLHDRLLSVDVQGMELCEYW